MFVPPFSQEPPWHGAVSGHPSLLCSSFPASWVLARAAVAAGRAACGSDGGWGLQGGLSRPLQQAEGLQKQKVEVKNGAGGTKKDRAGMGR